MHGKNQIMAVLLNLKSLIYRTKSGQSRLCHEGTGMGRSPVEGSVFFDGNLLHRISRSLEDEKEGGLLPRGWHEKAMHHQNRLLVEGFSGGGDPCNKGLGGGAMGKGQCRGEDPEMHGRAPRRDDERIVDRTGGNGSGMERIGSRRESEPEVPGQIGGHFKIVTRRGSVRDVEGGFRNRQCSAPQGACHQNSLGFGGPKGGRATARRLEEKKKGWQKEKCP